MPGLEERLNIAQELADALNYLHERKIIFRDLKPANIGFSLYNNKLKLFDFGLSRELPKDGKVDSTFVMSGVGTFRYMAIEVSKGLPYNCKADVYGWSMILWQMLSLRQPYEEYSTKDDYYLKVCEEGKRLKLSGHIPNSIEYLLEDCWTEDISRRLHMNEVYKRIDEIKKDQLQIRMGKARQRLSIRTASPASHQVVTAM